MINGTSGKYKSEDTSKKKPSWVRKRKRITKVRRRNHLGEDGVYVFLPFITKNVDALEASQLNIDKGKGYGTLVNVGWIPLEEYKKNKLRNFKLPDKEDFEIVNNELSKELSKELTKRRKLQHLSNGHIARSRSR